MLLYKKSDRRRQLGGNINKVYLQCKDPHDTNLWIQSVSAMDVNQERAIVQALINDGVTGKNQQIVVKLGTSPFIRKEYEIGNRIKVIPGFIRFICSMECPDDLNRYKGRITRICTSETDSSENVNVLIMPFYEWGTVRKYPWESHPTRFVSCLKQIVLSLYVAFIKYGFIHTDIHMDNVLLSGTKKNTIKYELPSGHVIQVPTHGIRIHIMDLENSFMSVDINETSVFWRDMDRVMTDIKHAGRFEFSQLHELCVFTEMRLRGNPPLFGVWEFINIIDTITDVHIQPPPRLLTYDPNVFGERTM